MEKATCFEPIYHNSSKILILGTMPSVQSVKYGFYYMGSQNYFWRLLTDICGVDFISQVKSVRAGSGDLSVIKNLLNDLGIALFDTFAECMRTTSGDDDLFDTKLNSKDSILKIIKNSNIKKIFCTSILAYENLKKIFSDKKDFDNLCKLLKTDVPFERLYSPSSRARAPYSERLKDWEKIRLYL